MSAHLLLWPIFLCKTGCSFNSTPSWIAVKVDFRDIIDFGGLLGTLVFAGATCFVLLDDGRWAMFPAETADRGLIGTSLSIVLAELWICWKWSRDWARLRTFFTGTLWVGNNRISLVMIGASMVKMRSQGCKGKWWEGSKKQSKIRIRIGTLEKKFQEKSLKKKPHN